MTINNQDFCDGANAIIDSLNSIIDELRVKNEDIPNETWQELESGRYVNMAHVRHLYIEFIPDRWRVIAVFDHQHEIELDSYRDHEDALFCVRSLIQLENIPTGNSQ